MSKPTKIDKKLSTFSDRVKMIDMHPREPLVICSLYNGQVTLWNYETKNLVKSFEILDAPIRCVKFIVKLQSFACGADDMNIRIYNYNTMEKTKTFVAHDDYLRCIAVHDQLPIMLTSSDDMRIKAWDWSRNWACTMIFEGHQHYVMSVCFNPKDAMTFASASLDMSIKVWNLSSPEPNYSLIGHEDAINCVEYYPGGDKPYLVSGSDDNTVKIWDYQTRACIQTLTHHVHHVTATFFHPDVPLLFTGGEDEVIGVVNTQTWRTEQNLNYGMQRAWTITARPGSHHVGIGFDRGMVVLKVGSDEPVLSMDGNGKLYMALGNAISRFDIKNVPSDTADGEALRIASKEVGTSEALPIAIAHGPSGQNIAVISDHEYTVYSGIQWRSKTFGPCVSFAWGRESGSYAVLETPTTIKLFKGLKPGETVTLPEPADKLFSGPLLAVRTAGAITFIDWDTMRVVRRIEARPTQVSWSDSNELVALILESSFYILRFNAEIAAERLPTCTAEDGIEEAFDTVDEGEETIRQATWVGDCLCFVNQSDRLNYYIGGEYTTVAVLNRGTHLLGYLPKENRLFCIDRDRNITSYVLHVSVVEYKGAIVREDFEAAEAILPRIPTVSRDKVAQFLQGRGHLQLALEVTTEDDHRFDLAITLGLLDTALDVAKRIPATSRWKQIGDLALEQGAFDVAEPAMYESGDLNGLLLMYTCTGDREGLRKLGNLALQKGKTNVAFTCCHLLSDYNACTQILLQTNRIADAAFYARTYNHDHVDEVVQKWKNSVAGLPRVRDSIADPAGFPNLFPNMSDSITKKANAAVAATSLSSPVREVGASPITVQTGNTPNLFSPEQPSAPAPTPATTLKPEASPSHLFSPLQPRAPDTTPATVYKKPEDVASPTNDLFSPQQPSAPQPTPATNYRPAPALEDGSVGETPMVVRAANAALAAGGTSSLSSTVQSPKQQADQRLDYSPEREASQQQHVDPTAGTANEEEPEAEEEIAPAETATDATPAKDSAAATSPKAQTAKDDLDDIFGNAEPEQATSPKQAEQPAKPSATGDGFDEDGFDDEDWN